MTPSIPGTTELEPVCCLDCGKEYAKPTGRGTLSTNPGCPHCSYIGWLPTSESLKVQWPRDRSAVDRLQRLFAPTG